MAFPASHLLPDRPDPGTQAAHLVRQVGDDLNQRLRQLHEQLLESVPAVDRIACVLYEPKDDLLKTFVTSTRAGEPLKGYEFRLQDSASLQAIASSGRIRAIDEIAQSVQPTSPHSDWLLNQGYRSSLTVPVYDNEAFIGFLFYDSLEPAAFSEAVQRRLEIYNALIALTITNELNLVRSITTSAQVAREFANLRDFETGGHLERMAHYARLIARDLAESKGLSDEYVEHLYLFAPLHDIGKIGIPDSVLLKPGRLNDEERQLMNTHVQKGIDVLERMIGDFGLQHVPDAEVMRNVVAGHHECLDGSGYPHGLKGDAIALEARIIAAADILDALTSHRPYKEPWPIDAALAELERLVAAGKLDGECVDALKRHTEDIEAIRERFRDAEPIA
jgi:HD-GYP domain-containing protein (c-di-GMP phosphodiesterase class II)